MHVKDIYYNMKRLYMKSSSLVTQIQIETSLKMYTP